MNVSLQDIKAWTSGTIQRPEEQEEELMIVTSGEPVEDFAYPGIVGTLPGRNKGEDVYVKVLSFEKKNTARILAVTSTAIKDKKIDLEQNKPAEIALSSLGLKGSVWVHVHNDKPAYVGFDHR
jgi:hypothetical protein